MRPWILALLLFAIFAPATANAAWWQKDWPLRKQITIDSTAAGITGPVGRTSVLVRLHSGNFNFADAKEDGSDLRFVAGDDKTPLNFQVEGFDALLGVAAIWVDVPDLKPGAAQPIWLYFGNKAAPAAAAAAKAELFDADYTLVYHFGDAAGAPPKDATAYGSAAQTAPSGVSQASIIGKGARFDGASAITVAPTPALAIPAGGAMTFSAWIKPGAAGGPMTLFSRAGDGGSLAVGLDANIPFVQIGGGAKIAAAQAVTADQWSLITVTAANQVLTLYVDGKSAGVGPGALPALSGPISIGGDVTNKSPGFVGEMDEVRLSKVARTAGAVLADAASQGSGAKLIAYKDDEKQGGGGFGLLGVIIKNVDGVSWIVIGLLGVLALLSWWVIATKVGYAASVDSANERFVKDFRDQGGNPLIFAEADRAKTYGDSCIYRVYRAGADEIIKRIPTGQKSVHMDSEGVNVLRALMDATLTRENQRLGRSLVWLTIAISGGPFLGLLGTVLGVMFTFAAIALAGDVNINAIAPGISAALLATVAGLGVAIPALFGYNYILIRNKNISANMLVFTDEFATRISENFRASHQSLV